jgi:hypothetical protein
VLRADVGHPLPDYATNATGSRAGSRLSFPSLSFSRVHPLKNPWLKKNPFMSMWLSGANSVLGSARSRATAEGHRQAARMFAEGQRQMLQFWTGGTLGAGKKSRKSR